jgi:hypothetical protein
MTPGIRFVVAEYASLLTENADAFAKSELILPTPEHFPDEFNRDAESVHALLERTMSYTPLADDLEVRLGFVEGEAEDFGAERRSPRSPKDKEEQSSCSKPGCGSGGSGWSRVDGVLDEDDGYRVLVHVADTGSPARLVGSLARSVGALLSSEAGVAQDADIGARSEVWASAAGFGVLLLSASHVYSKSCGGVNVHQGTTLDVETLAMMLALFCAVRGIKPGVAAKHLGPTPKEAFEEAWRTVDSNRELVRKLRETPELLTDGVFELEPPKGILSRLFGRKRNPEDQPIAIARTTRSAEERRKLEEARALVEDALGPQKNTIPSR